MRLNWVLAVSVSLLFAASSWAGTIYVDAANVSGIEDGTEAFPFNTIQEGVDASISGDTVSVAPGIYYGSIEPKSQVPLISQEGPEKTVIDGMNSNWAVRAPYESNPSVQLEGFTVRNANGLIIASNRVSFWSSSNWTIKNCILTDALYVAIDLYPGVFMIVENTVITKTRRAIDSIWCPTPQLRNITIDDVESALFMYQNAIRITNVNISNVENFVELWGHRGSGSVYGRNSNVWNYLNYAVPNRNGGMPYINMIGAISEDPLFVERAASDYRLTSTSPLIDAGIDIGLPFSGDAPDIGAYEYDEVSIPAMLEELAESYQEVPLSNFKNSGEQRRKAINNKVMAVLEKLNNITEEAPTEERIALYDECINKLQNDILAKADGFYGGNPKNDWIITEEEQGRLYVKVMELITSLQDEIASLQ